MQNSLQLSDVKWKELLKFLKDYFAMEEWFCDCNEKHEVICAKNNIALVLCSVQRFFSRSDKTNGYNLAQMHGMTKMQENIKLFGSGMYFYGGP